MDRVLVFGTSGASSNLAGGTELLDFLLKTGYTPNT